MKDPVETKKHTVVWGQDTEAQDFIKVPRVFTRLGRYDTRVGQQVQPRHLMLLLNLAGRQFRTRPLRATWQVLARDLGVKRDTVRRWAYELRDLGLLTLIRPEAGDGDRRNIFHLAGFVRVVGDAFKKRTSEREHFVPRTLTDSFSDERD